MRSRTFASMLALLIIAIPALAAGEKDEKKSDLDRAAELMQSGDAAGAVAVLEPAVKSRPEDAQAWLALAQALRQAGDVAGAIEASRKAAAFEETAPAATYLTSALYAGSGQSDEAFAWLARAREKGSAGIAQITFDPRLANLYSDPRLDAYLPDRKIFDESFVEKTKVIRSWKGEAAGDQFGWIARSVGDVDGDGAGDVATSAPSNSDGGANAGKVYLYSGRSGRLLWSRAGEAGDQLGTGVEAAGDVNADGVPDVVAGAPGAGEAFVYSGKDGKTLLTMRGETGKNFGGAVSDAGDLDDDGHDDVIVGASGSDQAIIYSGKTGDPIVTLKGEASGTRFGSAVAGGGRGERALLVVGVPDAGEGKRGEVHVFKGRNTQRAFVIASDDKGAELGGMFVSVVGDVNADKAPDIYASDWAHQGKGRSTGKIYVHSGVDGSRLLELAGEAAGDGFGIGSADAGDVDGDGHDDLIIGAWRHSSAAPSAGKVYLFSGKDGSEKKSWTCRVPADTFGFDATGIGDVDGDGTLDLLLTSAWSPIQGVRSGRMLIVSGK